MGRRVSFSVKLRPSLKKEFMDAVKREGLSSCVIVEALLSAWLAGLKAPEKEAVYPGKSLTIVQKFMRVVKRSRRDYREVRETNRYINPPGIWIYDPNY